ncbi:Short-chain oxidoreductase VdlC [Helicobacter ailurogastricus]|uniref:Dehydrogenases with different specificities (Related to short-chain alcohol dehydrogenases) n=1 Tax=Helicobacter ailurogastricus TaxID=1578720 RepID=A0A0K2Y0Y3_9HELI|nr:SDR family NAD(P)-dependent oxidoreductase [Helicobacter ailurogastricus]BDQ28425.1 putative short-chain type dehydrogenase/reductase VdlC [Helicobacter ailurogastricus]GMB89457.1 Short-chain oxidoreductase VdlC [Helicobacter ailurogastricus]CRF52961.1 Dehydrogenases with different specificities (related to short-chain alcohol dehydrogenases) [Helicobacter ailurogastricus]
MLAVVLTGASSGIGLECAKALLQKGYRVYALSRQATGVEDLKHPHCVRLDCDLQDEGQIEKATQTILAQEKELFALINNAGYGIFGALEEQPIKEARALFETNLFSVGALCSKLLPLLRASAGLQASQRLAPKIINVASSAGRSTTLFLGWYHASKYALEAYSDCLRAELLGLGVQVVLIEPGAIKTKWDAGLTNALKPNSPYALELEKTHAYFQKTYENASPASLVATTILKTLESKHPKTRYLVGKKAHLLVWAKALLPDKIYDRILRQEILK